MPPRLHATQLAAGARAGGLAGAVLGVLDLGVLVRLGAPGRALLTALALDVGAGALLGALGAAIGLRLGAGWHRGAVRAATGAALGAVLGAALFSGSGIVRLGLAWPLRAAAVVLGALVVWRLGALGRRAADLPRWSLGVLGVGLYAVHATVLVRQYALLHGLLALGAFALLREALRGLGGAGRWAVVGLAASLGAGVWLGHPMGVRSVLRRAPGAQYPGWALGRMRRQAVVAEGSTAVQAGGPRLPLAGHDLVLVTIDALRADRLRALGGRGRMPVLDAMGARGVVFARAYCTTPHTSYSLASLMLGTHARAVMTLPGASRRRRTVAHALGEAGYRTAAFYPPAVFAVDGERFAALGAERFGFAHARVEFEPARDQVTAVEAWLAAQPPEARVFVWVHFLEPHEPYETQPGFDFGSSREARYDGECAAADAALGELRAVFARRGRSPSWMVTADHGEEFGDHGGSYHGTTVYDEQVRVPWVMEVAGVAPRVVDEPVSHVDLVPTVLAGVGLPRALGLRGVDLGGVAQGGPLGQDVFVAAGSLRALVRGTHKLVVDLADESLELYNLARDPRERVNLADRQPDLARRLRGRVAGWEAEHVRIDGEGMGGAVEVPSDLARAEQGDHSAAPEVARLLSDPAPAFARRAAVVLGELGVTDPGLRDALARALQHPEPSVAEAAAVSLGLLGDPRGLEGAIRALRATDPRARRRAALGLARLRRDDGVGILSTWLTDPQAPDAERDAVVAALRGLRAPGAYEAWVRLLDDLRLAPEAARALGELGDRRAIAPLRATLAATPYPLTRGAALGALLDLGDPTAEVRLRAALGAPGGVAEAVGLLRRVGEPGRRVAGWPGAVGLTPGRAVSVTIRGARGSVRRLYLRVESPGAASVECDPFGPVSVRAGTREYSAELGSAVRLGSLRCRSDAAVILRGVAVR